MTDQLERENAQLRLVIKAFADRIEKLAFQIPAPNPHTPELLQAVLMARKQLNLDLKP